MVMDQGKLTYWEDLFQLDSYPQSLRQNFLVSLELYIYTVVTAHAKKAAHHIE